VNILKKGASAPFFISEPHSSLSTSSTFGTFSPHPPCGAPSPKEKGIGLLAFLEKEIGLFTFLERVKIEQNLMTGNIL